MAWIDPVMLRNTSRSTPEIANCLKRIAPPERCQTIGDTIAVPRNMTGILSTLCLPKLRSGGWRPANWRLRLRRLGSKGSDAVTVSARRRYRGDRRGDRPEPQRAASGGVVVGG